MLLSEKFIKANDSICTLEKHLNAPVFRKEFELGFVPEKAELTICGLGFYEVYINGKDITKGPLAPYISNPNDVCYFDNYDISSLLKQGKNVIGIMLGNGFRNPFGGFVWRFNTSKVVGPVITSFAIQAKNGDKEFLLEADETVKTHPSPITLDDLRMGCRYDATLEEEIENWKKAGFDDSSWENAKIAQKPSGTYKICTASPIAVTDKIKPVSITHFDELPYAYENSSQDAKPIEKTIRKNVYVFDFGINMAGVTVLKINGKRGQKITIRHAEHLIRGNFAVNTTLFEDKPYIDRYLEYGQTDEYICKGMAEEVFIPKFKFDGFRYAYVEGLEKDQVNDDTLTYYVMNADVKKRAEFKCSDEDLNKLQWCADNSDLSNFYYFPVDCPHREKNGWTGDASASAEHMLLKFTFSDSLKEWLYNIQRAQSDDGMLPSVVPTGGFGYFSGNNGPAWDAVCVNLPYYMYKFDGDKSVIYENEYMIMKYLYYIMGKRTKDGLLSVGLGDWNEPFHAQRGYYSAPLVVTDTLEIIDIAQKAAHLFKEAKREYAEEFCKKVAKDLKDAFRKHLVDFESMTVEGDFQTCQVFAIAVGIFTDEERPRAVKRLLEIIHRDGDENRCGLIGLRYIYHILCEENEYDLAYKMMMSKERFGYGYLLKWDATTIFETMSDMNKIAWSLNHHYFADFSSVTIQEFAGLKPNPYVDDISYFEISPKFVSELGFAKASYDSHFGKISTKWTREGDDKIVLTVDAPNGVHGIIKTPKGYAFSRRVDMPIEAGHNEYVIYKKVIN